MAERKNTLTIDGGQAKEDDHVASYKPIPESDTDFRTSKSSLSKSKEKVSPDGAEEKLLAKEDEAKIVRVDMADAKYVVGDHRNGDAKIELDANKKQFSGLTKEELMKYADDPFWVNLRWCMFVLFWTLWLAMLAGAVAIIVRAPKCSPPTPKEWYEKYPLVESEGQSFTELDKQFMELESQLPALQSALAHGVFVEVPTYDGDGDILQRFKDFVLKAKDKSVKVIVDLTPSFVSKAHPWFALSENSTAEYADYFVWREPNGFDASGRPLVPNNWLSTVSGPAWTYSNVRKQFYLHQYGEEQPDLNFSNEKVVQEFKDVLQKWIKAGAQGVRLNKARTLLVNSSFEDNSIPTGKGVDYSSTHTDYSFWKNTQTRDLPGLDDLLEKFAEVVRSAGEGSEAKVFTMKEEGRSELFMLRNVSSLRPPSAAAVPLAHPAAAARALHTTLRRHWPMLQLKSDAESGREVALFAMMLPAAPLLTVQQIYNGDNDTTLGDMAALREDASLEHGNHTIAAVPAAGSDAQLIACARWKPGHTGYVAVHNPAAGALRANLSSLPTVPASLTVHLLTPQVKLYTNYTKSYSEQADNVLVPGKSTVVLSYVPETAAES